MGATLAHYAASGGHEGVLEFLFKTDRSQVCVPICIHTPMYTCIDTAMHTF